MGMPTARLCGRAGSHCACGLFRDCREMFPTRIALLLVGSPGTPRFLNGAVWHVLCSTRRMSAWRGFQAGGARAYETGGRES
jgi:hypothetical protein